MATSHLLLILFAVLAVVVILVTGVGIILYTIRKPVQPPTAPRDPTEKAEIEGVKRRVAGIERALADLETEINRKLARANTREARARRREEQEDQEEEQLPLVEQPPPDTVPLGPPRSRREVLERARQAQGG